MRVAILTTSYPAFPGDPSGHFVESEARLLIARAESVVVITPAAFELGPTQECARGPDGVTVWRVSGGGAFGWPGVAARVRERPWRLAGAALWIHRARRLVRLLGPFDSVVCHWALPCAFPVAGARARTPRGTLEVVSHGADVRLLASMPGTLRRALVGRLLREATRWRFVSRRLLDELAVTLDDDQRARLTSLAYVKEAALELPDVSTRASLRRAEHDAGALLVCVGRLIASKRFDRALAHVAALEGARVPATARRARVVVVGDGPERARLEAYARRLGVDARFVGRTSREDALAWIGAADALLHASQAEGLSTVVREAEALGVRVEVVQ